MLFIVKIAFPFDSRIEYILFIVFLLNGYVCPNTPTQKNISILLLIELSDPLIVSCLISSLSATSEAIFKLCLDMSTKYTFLYNFCNSRYLPVPHPKSSKVRFLFKGRSFLKYTL